MEKKTVVVGMSGGVDSSVAAYLLKEQGYNVIGLTMKHWEGMESLENTEKKCCTLDNVNDAKRVCDDLEIPHYVVNFKKDFKDLVIDYFVDEYQKGNTPNPCVVCNRYIKMGKLIDFAEEIGADYVATGHYAILKDGMLYKGLDEKKDQAYFLAQVKKEYMKKLMFPLGEYTKDKIREMAERMKVRTYAKKDSQEICFIEDDDYKRFLTEVTNGDIERKGNIVHINGEILGKHNGTAFYTIGQRKGLGISYPTPLYVLGMDTKKNEVIVGDNEKLFSEEITCKDINLLGVDTIEELDNIECYIKSRSRDTLHKAKLSIVNENQIKIVLIDNLVRAVTPGQLAVFYAEDGLVLGSGFIF